MRNYSPDARKNLLATAPDEPFLFMLEIHHEDLEEPIRVVADTQDITSKGNEFIACAFEVTMPDDIQGQLPQATLSVDNVGQELTQWLEYSRGGVGAKCRLIQILRTNPDDYELDITFDLTNLHIDNLRVSGTLGFQNTLALPAVVPVFSPSTAIGLW